MKKTILILITISSLFIASCGKKENEDIKDKDIVPVKVVELKKEMVSKPINASGQFTTDDETYLSFKTGGVINKIFVKEGDAIKKGQLLASLDLKEIDAMVQQAKAGYQKALRDFNRAENLYKDSVATLEQYQNARTGLEVAQKQLSIAEFNYNYSEIRALENGYILKKFTNEGQIVGSGMPVLQTNGAQKSNWFLKVSISDKEWATIKIMDKAEVTLDTSPGKSFNGHVVRRSEGVDPFTGTFFADIKLTSFDESKFASGMFGKATIFPSSKISAWLIPFDALLDADGNNGYVFVTNDNSTANKIKVTVSEIENEKIWITSGLDNYPKLIVTGSAYLNDNSKIRIDN